MLIKLNTWRMIITYGVGSDSDEWHVDMMIHLFAGRYVWFKRL
jgi:hypothetical protein